jgi:hypothetical protein
VLREVLTGHLRFRTIISAIIDHLLFPLFVLVELLLDPSEADSHNYRIIKNAYNGEDIRDYIKRVKYIKYIEKGKDNSRNNPLWDFSVFTVPVINNDCETGPYGLVQWSLRDSFLGLVDISMVPTSGTPMGPTGIYITV